MVSPRKQEKIAAKNENARKTLFLSNFLEKGSNYRKNPKHYSEIEFFVHFLGNRRITVSRVLFLKRELTEFCGKLTEFRGKLTEFLR